MKSLAKLYLFVIHYTIFIHPFFTFVVYNIDVTKIFFKEEKIMNEKKIKVAVIANGNRARCVVRHLLADAKGNVTVAAVFDPDKAAMERFCTDLKIEGAKLCESSTEAINTPGVEWVMVFSPNVYHKQHVLEAFAAGKHVFSEKPLATTIEDCQAIFDAHQKSGKLFATGFVLRYAPIYRRAKEILDSGKLGRIMTIEANENITPAHGGYIVCNWRRHCAISGPHILEKCCHDLDLINWFCGSLPSRVASFGKRDFFIPENQPIEDKYGIDEFFAWPDHHRCGTPFDGDTDMKDNQVCIAQYRNNILVSFTATMSNAIPERRMVFRCTEGTLELELYNRLLRYKNIANDTEYRVNFTGDGHGGGDDHIMKELYATMCTGELPKCSGNEGLISAVFALALDKAAETGSVIDIEPIWKNMNR